VAKRIDAEDTIDVVTHFLHRLQAEGWGIESLEHGIEYAQLGEKSKKMPVSAMVKIRLIPIRG